MATVNKRLRENPLLQKMPTTERDWVQWTNELAKFVLEVAKLGESLYKSDGTTIVSGLDEMPGMVPSERSLVMSAVGNNPSLQTSSPLTSSNAGATATIAVAAHTLKTPSGDISYDSGSITGLTQSTVYYVYTDDSDYSGGAATYSASTSVDDIVGAVGRYYIGKVTTANADASGNISGVTKGATTTITTSAAHGLSTGRLVDIDNIVDDGPGGDLESALNGNTYGVTVTTTTEFTISEDTSGLTNVYDSGGDWSYTAPNINGGTGGSWGGLLD